MTTFTSFTFSAGSARSTVFIKMPQSSHFNDGSGGGGAGGENGGDGEFFGPPLEPFPTSTYYEAQFSNVLFSSSLSLSSPSSSAAVTTLLSATDRPPPLSASSHSNRLPFALIIGGSAGGMVLGALLVFLLFYRRRQRAQRNARRSQALLDGKQDAEKGSSITPFLVPLVPGAPNVKLADWIRRNRNFSVSIISSFSSPTIIESLGERSSLSVYSQSSASRRGPEGNLTPPGLNRINE
ncbi:hypothetical protein B0H12DRAFT_1174059 [Mycena haematopus]|nr:hypothetical protein B0H12DRAFT_1174059 [Mycena haematopus]